MQTFGPNNANGAPLVLSMTGTVNDMSNALVTEAVATGRKNRFTFTFTWPTSIGAARPTGVFAVQANNIPGDDGEPDPDYWQTIPECSDAAAVAGQPNGDGASGILKMSGVPISDAWTRGIYTPTTGGTGVVPGFTVNGKE